MFDSEIYNRCLAESFSARLAGHIGAGISGDKEAIYSPCGPNDAEIHDEPSYGLVSAMSIPPVLAFMIFGIYAEAPIRYAIKIMKEKGGP